jgi:ribitol 2-dehydrogenase
MTHSFTGRTVVITGVTSGIGLATAHAVHDLQARVIGVGRNPERLTALAGELGERFEPLCAHLDDARERARVTERLARLETGPHVLVNNAAECVYESPLDITPQALARLFEVNVVAAAELARAAAAVMTQGAHIVQLSSVTAHHVANAKFAPYGATKACVEQLTAALRWELHPRGVSVTTVSPGLVDTPIYEKVSGFEGVLAKLKSSVPRWLSAQDVAEAIVWVLTRPAHLVVSELTLLPKGQGR